MSRGLTRRNALAFAGAAAAYSTLKPFAWAMGKSDLHALSVFGEFKYPRDFKHFDYIDPNAPKGGRINFQPPSWIYNQQPETFDTLNSFVLRGSAPPRMELVFDTLMAGSGDEADTIYGLVAESVGVSEDGNVYTFTLRTTPRFHDGSPLTAEDVAFSLMLLKEKGHPNIVQPIAEMVKAEATDERTVVVTLSGKQNRYTILTIATLPILSKVYYTANEFDKGTLRAPLGSGAYKVGNFTAGRYIEYERVPDYWGKDLNVNIGFGNFDVIRVDFYRERQAAFEAFKKGDTTFREEFTSKTWALEYNFPAVLDGRVKKTLFPEEARANLQACFFNTRREKFADPRTRQAISLIFDFEWANKNIFFGAYKRQVSYFQRSDFMAVGLPSPEELALLEPFRADLPAEVFGEPYSLPESDGSGRDRKLFRQATELLEAAGWKRDGNRVVDERGVQLSVEFLIDAEVFERLFVPYADSLKLIGIDGSVRRVDAAQYQSRTADFDFDIAMARWMMAGTPLDGLPQFFSSEAAVTPGTYNYAGIKDKAVDALLDRLPEVSTRAELLTLLRALDRILRAHHYSLLMYYSSDHRVAHWDLFGWPEKKPDYAFVPETTWWIDRDRAAAAGKPNG